MKFDRGCERELAANLPLAHARGHVLAWLTVGLACAACAADPVRLAGRAMGTTWAVAFDLPATPVNPAEVTQSVSRRLEQLERAFSTFRADSELSRFNATPSTEWFPVSAEVAEVAAESREVSLLTDGAFDATVEPLVRLWGFGPVARSSLPSQQEIAVARSHVGWRQIETRVSPPALRRTREDGRLDLSSMAKGFAADAISDLLAEAGIMRSFVQIGGDIRTRGAERGWRAGIEQPVAEGANVACVVELRGTALSTSGDYRNHFTVDGRRYGHIIDPRTGEPVAGDLAAVSVIAASCARSSALATGLFVLGAGPGWEIARREGLACVFFVRDGETIRRRATPEFERWIVPAVARR